MWGRLVLRTLRPQVLAPELRVVAGLGGIGQRAACAERGALQRRQAHTLLVATPEAVAIEERITALAQNPAWIDATPPAQPTQEQLDAFQQELGHVFSNIWLLRLALVHSSASETANNISLAWLGDMALGLLVTEQLMAGSLGAASVGVLANLRDVLISRQNCERQGRALGLDRVMVLGACLQGQITSNMVAEAFEALIGAVYLDAGLPAVRTVFLRHAHILEPPLPAAQLGEAGAAGAGGEGA